MPAIREVHSDGWNVRLDMAGQILQVDIPEYDMDFRLHDFETGEERLSPTVPTDPHSPNGAGGVAGDHDGNVVGGRRGALDGVDVLENGNGDGS
jgi:hypothetical protein